MIRCGASHSQIAKTAGTLLAIAVSLSATRAASGLVIKTKATPPKRVNRLVTTVRLAQATSTPTAADADLERKAKEQQLEAERKAKAEQNESERKAKTEEAEAARKARAAERDTERKVRAAEAKARTEEIEVRVQAQEQEAEEALKRRDEALRVIDRQIQAAQLELRALPADNSAPFKARRQLLEAKIGDLRAKSDTLRRMRLRTVPSVVTRSGTLVLTDGETVTSETMRRRQELYLSLDRAISVELRDATIRRAAEVMAQASGIPIAADPAVPGDKRLTVVAQVVSVKNILAEVARQTGLLIAPDNDAKGVILRPMPSLQVNGQERKFRATNAPWSAAWGNIPANTQLLSITGYKPGDANAEALAQSLKTATINVRQGLGGVTITGMGDEHFVVASPAPPGENGVMLTVYQLDGNRLRIVSTTLHRFDTSPTRTPPQPPQR